jgi:hypothetical protein
MESQQSIMNYQKILQIQKHRLHPITPSDPLFWIIQKFNTRSTAFHVHWWWINDELSEWSDA